MAVHTTPVQTPRRFIKLAAVKTLTTLSTSKTYRRITAGTFPAQVSLGPKSVVWIEADLPQAKQEVYFFNRIGRMQPARQDESPAAQCTLWHQRHPNIGQKPKILDFSRDPSH